MTAHDGSTRHDLLSGNGEHNAKKQDDNHDGADANHCWNRGAEGPSEDAAALGLRASEAPPPVARSSSRKARR